jgi:hypothetical protein
MTDRELLEAAARAALMWKDAFSLDDEWNPIWEDEKGFYLGWGTGWWNPLTDDGDALRLVCKLGLLVDTNGLHARVCFPYEEPLAYEPMRDDRCAATRRVIVRAAAAIGANKEQA